MKNQYFGDVGDYGKYAMLRFLAENNIKIAVNWYLTPDDGSNDGKHITYLQKEKERQYDAELFDILRCMVFAGNRSVTSFQEKNVIPKAVYYDVILSVDGMGAPERRDRRKRWHRNAMETCRGAELVFLDPDNGAYDGEPKLAKNTIKYCYGVVDYFHAGQDVVYYCQKGRRTPEQWENAKNLMKRIIPEANLMGITFHRGTQRTYIFVLHDESCCRYKELLADFLGRWKKVFTEEKFS